MSAGFSILTAAYNASTTIAQTVASVRAQSRTDWELIVVDDGSTDETAELVARASGGDPRIRVVRQENSGTAVARNHAFSHASGDWIVLLDADDLLLPTYLQSQWEFIQDHPGYDVYSTNAWVQTPDGVRTPLWRSRDDQQPHEVTALDQIAESSIVAMTVMNRRVWDLTGGFRSVHSEDYDFWLRALILGARAVYNPEILSVYVRRAGSKTRALVREAESFLDIQRLALQMPEVTPAMRSRLQAAVEFSEARVGRRHLEERLLADDLSSARRDYIRYRRAFPDTPQYLVGLLVMVCSPRLYARIKRSRMV